MELRRTTFVITQKCTLKCRLCLAFIPYYETPVHTSIEEAGVILENYFKIVENVGIFSVTGGEPLLNPAFYDIMKLVYTYGRQIRNYIDIVTNGTMLMDVRTLELLKKNAKNTRVIISDYGKELSRKKEALVEQLQKYGIFYRVQNYAGSEDWLYDGWVDFTDHSLKHTTPKELERQALRCIFRQGHYYVINEGELHPCSRSFWRMYKGIISRDEEQFLDLLHCTPQIGRTKLEHIEKLVALNSCAYCNGVYPGVKRYRPAEQL